MMNVSIDLCIVPVGVGVSVSAYVAACAEVIQAAGLSYRLNANNTEVEGEWDAVMAAVKRCHEVVHKLGAPRIVTSMRLNTPTDKAQTLADKINSVQTKMGASNL